MQRSFIKTITARGLKTGDFTNTLEPVTMIVAPAMRGKTARLDAVRLALKGGTLLGRKSELNSQKSSILDIARGTSMEVSITDSLERTNRRKWSSKPKEESCEIPETPDILIDSSVYFSLSQQKRIDYVFGLARMDDKPEFSPVSILASVKNIRLEENTTTSETAIRELVDMIDKSDKKRSEEGGAVKDWIGTVIAELKERLSGLNAKAKMMTGTVQGLTALSTTQARRNPDADIKEARERADKLRETKGQLDAKSKTLGELELKLAGLQSNIAKESADAATATEQTETIARQIQEIETDVERTEAELARLQSEGKAEAEKMQAELNALNKEVEAYQSKTSDLKLHIQALSNNLSRAERDQAQLKAEKERWEKGLVDIKSKTNCPHCGAHQQHWTGEHTIEAFEKMTADELFAIDRKFAAIEEQRSADQKAHTKRTYELAASETNDKINADATATARNLQSRLTSSARILAQQVEERQSSLKKDREEIARLLKAKEVLASAGQRVTTLRQSIAEVTASITAGNRVGLDQMKATAAADIKATDEKLASLEQEKKAYIQAKSSEAEAAKALLDNAKTSAAVTTTKAAIEVLTDIQGKMVAAAFEPMLKVVNRITGSVMPEPIEYRDGELGRFTGSTWVKEEVFSGTERALTFAGLSIALAGDAPIRVVLLDEMGRLDRDNIEKVLHRMQELVATGEIDQFVGCLSWDSKATKFETANAHVIAL